MSRIDSRGGKMYSFCAMNSLRMSFWIVPDSFFQSAPCFSATTRYIAKIIGAGELIVIDVVILAERDPLEEPFHVGERHDADAALPHFAERQLVIRVAPHQRRQVERHAQPGPARLQQRLVALVGFFGRPEPGELPHRPQLAAVAGRMDAARVGELARVVELAGVVESLEIIGGVEAIDDAAGNGRERLVASGAFFIDGSSASGHSAACRYRRRSVKALDFKLPPLGYTERSGAALAD